MDELSAMPSISRTDLELAARRRFTELVLGDNQPRGLHPTFAGEDIAFNIEESRTRIVQLDHQLRGNQFDRSIEIAAEEIILCIGGNRATLTKNEWLVAQQLCARAERERQVRFVQQLETPAQPPEVSDTLFAEGPTSPVASSPVIQVGGSSGLTWGRAGELYLSRKVAEGVGLSQRTELKRVIDWFSDRVGTERLIGDISKIELRSFRDSIGRVDVRLRGRKLAFDARLTGAAEHQIQSSTALRYWYSIQALFAWAEDEGHIDADPAAGLKLAVKKGQTKNTPPPFSQAELERFCQSPLYNGYLSPTRPMLIGTCHVRDGRWWMGVLMMMTGMRAGEVSQLLPIDFVFDHAFPHLKVRRDDGSGNQIKSVKSESALRDVPLASPLLTLGLQQFVQRRAASRPKDRLFREFRLGANDRKSDGATKFWGEYNGER